MNSYERIKNMKIVVTGGIGSGKSTVTELLRREFPNFGVLSVDKLVAKMYEDPMIGDQLIDKLGTKNKDDVREIVFKNEKLRLAVEEMFSSQIRLSINSMIDFNKDIIIEFPLLFEKGMDMIKDFDVVISVLANESIRIRRVIERSNLTEERVQSILDAQTDDETRRFNSDHVIINNDDLDYLKKSVTEVAKDIRLASYKKDNKKIGMFAGSFDPITLGHQHLIKKSLEIVDFLIVGISTNKNKTSFVKGGAKAHLIESSLVEFLSPEELKRVYIKTIPEHLLTIKYAKKLGVNFMFRGIRSATDLDYESQINLLQKKIEPSIETIYLITPRELMEISSSLVKSIYGLEDWELIAKDYVSKSVLNYLSTEATLSKF